jgi:hypothetical protein
VCNMSNNTSHYWFFGLSNLQQSFSYNLDIFSVLFLSSWVTQYQITLLHTHSSLRPPTNSIVSLFDSFTSLLTIHLIFFPFFIYLKHTYNWHKHTHTHITKEIQQPNARNTIIPFSTIQGEVINTILNIHNI